MKIAIINQPPGILSVDQLSGSISILSYHLAKHLTPYADVLVYANRGPDQSSESCENGIQFIRIKILFDRFLLFFLKRVSKYFPKKRPLFASGFFYVGFATRVAKSLKTQNCQVVHVINYSQFVPIVRFFNPDIKIILHMACEWLSQFDSSIVLPRIKKSDFIVGCSEYVTKKIQEKYPVFTHKCFTIYNGVDVKKFTPKQTDPSQCKNRILFVGRVSPEKGIHTVINAVGQLRKAIPDVHLDIIGPKRQIPIGYIIDLSDDELLFQLNTFYDNKSYYGYLLDEIERSDLDDHITFLGSLPNVDIVNYYNASDIVVQPSFSDAFPLTVLDAMSSGLPVVASDIGGIPEAVVHQETGLLVPVSDNESMFDALYKLMTNHSLRAKLGKKARERAIECFSWDIIAKQWFEIYKKA